MNQGFDPTRRGKPDAGRFHDQAEQSWTLPSDWYFDPAIYRQEHEAIFYRTWWYQCHVSNIPNQGDYYVGRVADQSVAILRGHDGTVRAFYNVCSHRAHPLLTDSGNVNLIVCPYHQWCYRSDGKFQGARGRSTLRDWIPENADLKPVRLEEFDGFLFVNLDPDAEPLVAQAGKLFDDMRERCPRLKDLVHAHRFEREVRANWKTIVDNNHECYHCDANHKSLMELVDYGGTAVWSDSGITFSHAVENNSDDNTAYPVDRASRVQQALFGFVFPGLIPLMFPGTPSLAMFQVIPTGPETALERWDFHFLDHTPSGPEQRMIDYIRDTLIPEDVGLCERVQVGLHSKGYRQGRFVVKRDHPEFSEHHVHFFQKFVYDALTGR